MARNQNARQFVEESKGEEYLHKHVWRVVKHEIEEAETDPVGAAYKHLIAMVFAAHTIEGYLNYLGMKIAPAIWKDERTYFRTTGMEGKLRFVRDELGLGRADRNRPPYSTMTALKALRDHIAHPKLQQTQLRKRFREGQEPPLFVASTLDKLVDREKAMLARDHVREITAALHAVARVRFPNAGLDSESLEGIMGFRSSTLKLAPNQ